MRAICGFMAVAFAGQSASAQVDENDRLQRCVNNRDAMVPIIAELQLTYSDEDLARAQVALGRIMDLDYQLQVHFDEIAGYGDPHFDSLLRRIQEAGQSVAVTCTVLDLGCGARMVNVIRQRVDEAIAVRPIRQALERRYAEHRNNLIALRCDQAANTTFTIAGVWTGSNGLTYQIGQTGNTIGWQVASISETGRGSIAGRTVTASWNGNWGPGSSTGTVTVGADGAANRISWNNGVTFTR